MKRLILFFSMIFIYSEQSTAALYSRNHQPKFSAEYYINQGMKYFDSIDSYAPKGSKPKYAKTVIRWEWYPWLKLTGRGRFFMKLDVLLKLYPTEVIDRDCRFFEVQPFTRCRVVFNYKRKNTFVPIYEEFTFNDRGEISFIEAWTDKKDLLPMDPSIDPWAEGNNVRRLSTKVPGLGTRLGTVKARDKALKKAAIKDKDLKDLRKRLKYPVFFWVKELFRYLRHH